MQRIRSPRDFWAGLLFIGIGIFAIVAGSAYQLGSAARMGPGYFPRILGILLVVLGAIITFTGTRVKGEAIARWNWRATIVVLGSVILFGYSVEKIGIAFGTVLLIVAASFASHEFRPRESLVSGVLLAALAVGVFVIGLHLQLPIWPQLAR